MSALIKRILTILCILTFLLPLQTANAAPPPPDEMDAQAIALGKTGTVYRYEKTFGVSEQAFPAYPTDHFGWPHSVWVQADGSVLVSDPWAKAVRKYDANGSHLADFGHPGTSGWPEGYFDDPLKMASTTAGTIFVTDHKLNAVRILNADGEQIGWLGQPGGPGNDDGHFDTPEGIFISNVTGNIYVADRYNHRIQVFDIDTNYLFTVGETGVSGNDDNHLNAPTGVAVDAAGNIYVADSDNNRVVKFDDDGDYQAQITGLEYPTSVAVDNIRSRLLVGVVYDAYVPYYNLADLSYAGAFGELDVQGDDTTHFAEPHGVAVDEVGSKVYIADSPNRRVMVYNAGTGAHLRQIGTTGEAIPTDDQHFFEPYTVEVEPNGSIILGEGAMRLIKLNPDGSAVWTVGQSGFWGQPPDRLDGSPNGIVSDGKTVYVAMSCTIYKFNSADGAYLGVFAGGGDCWAPDSLFQRITDIARDSAGNIYAADGELHRVVQLNKYGAVLATVGVRGEMGSDNARFRSPQGLAVDKARNVYVADEGNCRVQKFDKYLRYVMTFSTTLCGDNHDRLGGPQDVAVNAKGNVFVAEDWNNRIQIYDKAGAYLSSIGGSWGGTSGQLRVPMSLAMDKKGNLFVADRFNHRIQVYAPGVPYFGQQNLNGFGRREANWGETLAFFKNQLYAGTNGPNGGQIWRKGKTGWERVIADGFENWANVTIGHLLEYKGYLYATTANTPDGWVTSEGGQIWRTADGLTWAPVVFGGFGDTDNHSIHHLEIIGGDLCAATWAGGVHGPQVWCSSTGDMDTWEQRWENRFGGPDKSWAILDFVDFAGATFAATVGPEGGLYRRSGDTWTRVSAPIDSPDTYAIGGVTAFKEALYIITATQGDQPSQVYRCTNCTSTPITWELVGEAAEFPVNNHGRNSTLFTNGKTLYALIGSPEGLVIWSSTDGQIWKQASLPGLGDSLNERTSFGHSIIFYKNAFYLSMHNFSTGVEVWKFCPTAKSCK